MTSDGRPFEKTWSRTTLVRILTGAKAQILVSAGVGLLVWADVISAKVPFYFLHEAAQVVREAASFVAGEATHLIPEILDQFEKSKFSIADAVHMTVAIAIFYLGYRFFIRIWRALKKIYPTHWGIWPRIGLRRKLLLAFLLGTGVIAAWQLGAFPLIGSQFQELGRQTFGQLSLQNLFTAGEWLWRESGAIYENKGTVFPAVKGVLAALATYVALEVARAVVDLVSPVVRLGHTVYIHAYPRLPDARLSRRQKDWLHGMGSIIGGLIFGFNDLAFPSIPVFAWAALAPGLFLFARERPVLASIVSKAGLRVGRSVRAAAEFALARPKLACSIIAGFILGVTAASALFFSHPFSGFSIIWGVIKAAYVGMTIALLIAAGRGFAVLVARIGRTTGQLALRASEVRRDMRLAATKIINLFRNPALPPVSHEKTPRLAALRQIRATIADIRPRDVWPPR
jgi:hypothetical protein